MNAYKRAIIVALKSGKTVRRRRREAYRRRAFVYRWWHDYYGVSEDDVQREYDEDARDVFTDGHWIMRAPNNWMHVLQTVPERLEAKRLAKKVVMLIDLEDAPPFPDGTKIQHGYW